MQNGPWGKVRVGGGAIVIAALALGCDSDSEDSAIEAAARASARAEQAEAKTKKLTQEVSALKAQTDSLQAQAAQAAKATQAAEPVSSAVAPEAPPPIAAKPGEYSTSLVRAVQKDCKSPSVMLAAVTNSKSKKKDFAWTFAVQALFAHPEFVLTNKSKLRGAGRIAVQEIPVTPKVLGLVAHCKDAATCNRLAAMFKTTVPTSKPEVYCGKQWGPGAIPRGLLNATDLRRTARGKLKEDAFSMCARIGVCTKQQNPAAPGDPGVECQKQLTKYKYKCASERSCAAVVECTQG